MSLFGKELACALCYNYSLHNLVISNLHNSNQAAACNSILALFGGVDTPGPHRPIKGLGTPTSVFEVLIKMYQKGSHDRVHACLWPLYSLDAAIRRIEHLFYVT